MAVLGNNSIFNIQYFTLVELIKSFWNKASRNGLRPEEGIHSHREVIFLNKILIISPIIVFLIIPVEIILNGYQLIPLELTILGLYTIPVCLQYFRLFWLAKLSSFLLGNTFILVAGILVGKGINNQLAIIPLMLFGILMFKNTRDKILILVISLLYYFILNYCWERIEPVFIVSEENKNNFTYMFFVMSLVLTFLLGYYSLNINREYEVIINDQKEKLSEKNKEVTDSINYALRIQQAILPSKEDIYSALPNSFILFKPKDIVSGDFYFYQKTGDLIFIAAADSTGHGVPGAMVSVVCSNALNRTIKEFKLTETGKILDKTRELVLETFEKSASEVKDGMDVSLLCIDSKNKNIFWSGANNPLWYIQDSELKEIKADKQPIGKTDSQKPFKTHQIEYKENTSFYLFTDGFADQFGGPNGKKFKYKQFSQLLEKNSSLSPNELSAVIESAFNIWKGELEQVDDVCVIGLKV